MFRKRNSPTTSSRRSRLGRFRGRSSTSGNKTGKKSFLKEACMLIAAFLVPIAFLELVSRSPQDASTTTTSNGGCSHKLQNLVHSVPQSDASTTTTKTAPDSSMIADKPLNTNPPPRPKYSAPPNKPKLTAPPLSQKVQVPNDKTIAYVVPFVTNCGRQEVKVMRDAAAVLRHSIHLQSAQTPSSGSQYGYQMYALTKTGKTCHNDVLDELGYKILETDSPVLVSQIQNDYVKSQLDKNKEGQNEEGSGSYIELMPHDLVEEPIFVMLYIHALVLKPLDDLFLAIQYPDGTLEGVNARANITANLLERPRDSLPNTINHFFVRDYPNTEYQRKPVALTHGFMVAKRNPAIIQDAIQLIHQGNYMPGTDTSAGWGGKGYSMYFQGGLTMPGFYAYFLDQFHADTSVELDGCKFNHNGMDNLYRNPPRFQPTSEDQIGKCRSGEAECGDCTRTDVESIFTILYEWTCPYPWKCNSGGGKEGGDTPADHCLMLQKAWHNTRAEMEMEIARKTQSMDVARGQKGPYEHSAFHGHCVEFGDYLPLALPRHKQLEVPNILWGGK